MKILVFVDHDIIVRHFLHSGVFAELSRHHDVVYVLPEAENKRITLPDAELGIDPRAIRRLRTHRLRLALTQKMLLTNLLVWRPGRQHAALRTFHRHVAGRKAALLHSFLALPGIHSVFKRIYARRLKAAPHLELEALLDAERPDVVIHPTVLAGLFINDLVTVCGERGIPLVAIMNSWDNPSTKRAMTGSPDWLLVWGPQTHQHAVDFLKMPPERVICFGSAQFNVFRNPSRLSRAEFCARHELSPDRRILLYAGSSKGTDEFKHLCMLDDAIENATLPDAAVVYRPHPWGNGGKGGSRIIDHEWRHVRIEATMKVYLDRVKNEGRAMATPDYRDTHDLLSCIDALVSPLSTILLEGAMHGKPALCFLPAEDEAEDHYRLALPMIHFEGLFSNPLFPIARGDAELVPSVGGLLVTTGDEAFGAKLQQACEHFVTSFPQGYERRLREFIETLSRTRGHRKQP